MRPEDLLNQILDQREETRRAIAACAESHGQCRRAGRNLLASYEELVTQLPDAETRALVQAALAPAVEGMRVCLGEPTP